MTLLVLWHFWHKAQTEKRILHRILRYEEEEQEEYTQMGQKLDKHIACVKHRTRRAARIWTIKIVCAHGYCHRVTRLCYQTVKGAYRKREKKKDNLQSPLHPVQEMVQKQGHFTDNLLEYRYIWFGCLDNSCYATQIYIFSVIFCKVSVHIAWTSKVRQSL